MKNLYKLLIIAVLCPLFSNAQSNFKPGYVVALNGDTIRGTIDYKEWTDNPRYIKFKANNSTQVNQYSVANADCFSVDGYEYYKRFVLPISQDWTEVSRLSMGIDTTRITDTVFLRSITSGKNVILYSYTDRVKERFFIADNKAQPTELAYHLYTDAANKITSVYTYKRQLQKIAAMFQPGNVKLSEAIQVSNYKLNDLKKVALAINGAEEQAKLSGSNRDGTRFFAGIGAANSVVSFSGDHVLSKAGSSNSVLPKINAGVDVYINKNVGRWLFRAELSLMANKASFMYNENDATSSSTYKLKFDQYIVSLNPQMVYNLYNTNKFKFYLAAGLAIDGNVCTSKQNSVDHANGSVVTSGTITFPKPVSVFYNITTKAGAVLNNKLEIYAGYNPSTTMTNYILYSMNLTSYQVGVNFLFGKK
jgi:hypothetical protein